MKIAIDVRTAAGEKTGKGWYTFNLVRNLLKVDHKNSYILYAKNPVPGFEEFKNVKQKAISSASVFWHFKVAHDVKMEKADIYFSPTSFITPVLIGHQTKKIITVHDLVAILFPRKHQKKALIIEKLLLKFALKSADKIVVVSKNTGEDLLDYLKCPSSKISVVYCAAGEEFKRVKVDSDFARKTSLPKKFFLAVGTLEPRKNYINLIKALALFSEKISDYHLIVVGREGWDFEEIYTEITKNYLAKKVHILGYLSGKSLVNLYNSATAFVFPSLYEGFGIPPLEAMKCGCPVIASKSSSIPEVVGSAALLIDPRSPESITKAMTKVAKNSELRQNMISRGLVQAEKFSWKTSAAKLLEIFEECHNL